MERAADHDNRDRGGYTKVSFVDAPSRTTIAIALVATCVLATAAMAAVDLLGI